MKKIKQLLKKFISKIKKYIRNRQKKLSNKKYWLWEFSKKVVFSCFLLYMIEQIFLMCFYYKVGDTTQLTNLNDNITTVLKDCVFAYFIKAGIENIFKIKVEKKENNDNEFPTAI